MITPSVAVPMASVSATSNVRVLLIHKSRKALRQRIWLNIPVDWLPLVFVVGRQSALLKGKIDVQCGR
jgi:hypothetical protein